MPSTENINGIRGARESSERSDAPRPSMARYDKAFPVYLSTPEGVCRGIARSISEVGMFIETREPNEIGTIISISFVSPYTGDELTVSARVRSRCVCSCGAEDPQGKLSGMGVNFLDENGEEIGSSGSRGKTCCRLSWSFRKTGTSIQFPVN